MPTPHDCITQEQENYLIERIKDWSELADSSTPQELVNAGLLFPEGPPAIWNTLPDEWDKLMDASGITGLNNSQIESYLEKWNRLLGYAYWIESVWDDRTKALNRCLEFVKDFVFTMSDGGREQKAAVAGSHWITTEVLAKVNAADRKHTELKGLIRRWEKIEFSISRTITSRQNR